MANDARKETLDDWLDYQQRVHPRSIELGLARVREVWQRLGAAQAVAAPGHPWPTRYLDSCPAPIVITVGGTNGKGSTVAFLEAMLAAMGKRVGCYTSPHLQRYNERVRLLGREASDAELIDAFERIEAARLMPSRDAIALTYFEFGTLAALWIFAQNKLDVAVLEVGLGGRLDAVNIVDADAAIVTTVDLDHQDWLGNDRDSIGREKAGIFRAARPAIIGMRDPPRGLLDEAKRIGAEVMRASIDFEAIGQPNGWTELPPSQSLNVLMTALALDSEARMRDVAEAVGITGPVSRPREIGSGDELERVQRENVELRRQLAERNKA